MTTTASTPETTTSIRTSRRARRDVYWFLAAVGAGLVFFVAVGFAMAFTQERRLAAYRPAPAYILSATVEQVRATGAKRTDTYLPVVRYHYQVDGRTYQGTRVTPLGESRGREWAQRLTEHFPPGALAVAYYDPADPGTAFLVRQRSFIPYIVIACPLLLLIAWGWLLTAVRRLAGTAEN
ncbi:MAG: DUF3592 domain-containing protein [Gemmatimonadetes bacterium]|nr:DUF3592 domain-containing protein [Gemmatimonadota bacterium]